MEHFLYKRLENEEKSPKINVLWAYPAIKSFALASLGYLIIFKDLDLNPDLYVERAYLDSDSIGMSTCDIDCAGFSFSFEMDIFNVIKMLKKYDIPLKSSERSDSDPIIFGGGPVLTSNPLPYQDFFDFISIGEKITLKRAFEVLKEKRSRSREDILKELSELEGIYVPKYPKKEIKILRDNLDEEIAYTSIISDESFFKDTFIVELERGCPKMCNFCLASWINLPCRFAPYEKIIEALELGLKYTDKIALLGAYVAGHPRFDDIIKYISKKIDEGRNIELSISSLRADLADIELVKTLVKCNQKTATIALEAGSQRLRDLINKDLNEEQILNTIKTALEGGLKGIKIYLMLGLPTENEEDIEQLIELTKKMKQVVKHTKKSFEITLSASTFVPKIHTPFEDCTRCDKKTLEKRINYLKKELHKLGITFRASSIEWDMIQTILSRYNDSLADFLIEVVENKANLGTFKQLWRQYAKKGTLSDFETAAQAPFTRNIKALFSQECINTGARELKTKRKYSMCLDR